MKKLNHWIVLGIGTAALGLGILLAMSPTVSAAPGTTQVTIANTPLPVSGTVTAAQASNSVYNVAFASPPTVQTTSNGIFVVGLIAEETPPYSREWINPSSDLAVIDLVNGGTRDGGMLEIDVGEPGAFVGHPYLFPVAFNEPFGIYWGSQLSKILVPPGATVAIGGAVAFAELSGHFEPMPAIVRAPSGP